MALVDDIRNCMSQAQRSNAAEMMILSRTTIDVSRLLVWVLVHKAVLSGEITVAEALEHPAHQLPEIRADNEVAGEDVATLPFAKRGLAVRTRTLHLHAGRLDTNLSKV